MTDCLIRIDNEHGQVNRTDYEDSSNDNILNRPKISFISKAYLRFIDDKINRDPSNPFVVSQSTCADYLGLCSGSIYHLEKKLVKLGLVRKESFHDGRLRVRELYLTDYAISYLNGEHPEQGAVL
jgi:DNA-binding MarR family transcriptional regulator